MKIFFKSYLSIINPDNTDDDDDVDPILQYPLQWNWLFAKKCSWAIYLLVYFILFSKFSSDTFLNKFHSARFTQAVADLQFLGFIKSTRKKTDHVKKLT